MKTIHRDGVHLAYEVKGPKDALETVMFHNGVMASYTSWSLYAQLFERMGVRVILYDMRGQLLSDKPEGPYTFEKHALDACAIMNAVGVKRAHMIGTSYGGEVAMKMAITHKARVASLTVIDSAASVDEQLKRFIELWIMLAKTEDAERFFEGVKATLYHPDYIQAHQADMAKRIEAMEQLPLEYYRGQVTLYETFLHDVDMIDDLEKITAPTLVVCGADDILKPVKFSEAIHRSIEKSEFVIIPECAHVAIFEKPQELLTLMRGFIAKNTSRSRG